MAAAKADNRKGSSMWFMIKGSFWFSLVLLALPFLDRDAERSSEAAAEINVSDSIGVVITAIEDIKQICERQPDVCEKGGQTIAALGVRAREGARVAYEFLDAKFADEAATETTATADASAETPVADGIQTGSLPAAN